MAPNPQRPPEPQDPGSQPRKSGLRRDPHPHTFPCSDIEHPKVTSPASPRAECEGRGLDKWRPLEERPPAGTRHPHPQPASRGSPRRSPLEPRSSAREVGGRALATLPLSHPLALRCRQGPLHHERGSLPPKHKEPSRVNGGSGDELRGHIPSWLTRDARPHRGPWRPRGRALTQERRWGPGLRKVRVEARGRFGLFFYKRSQRQ